MAVTSVSLLLLNMHSFIDASALNYSTALLQDDLSLSTSLTHLN
jgi:hypothetical protein